MKTSPTDFMQFQKSRGVALAVALLLLVIMTILGVASMSGVLMQERMAGNVNLQTWAFEAASAGVAQSVDFADPDNWGTDSSGDPRICTRGGGEWWDSYDDVSSDFTTINIPGLPDGLSVGFVQRLGCFEPENAPPEWDIFLDVPLQLLVLNIGEVRRGDEVLARREVEVRVDRRGEADCLLNMGALDLDGIDMGESKQGIVDGGPGGCPLRTSDPASAAEMREQLIGKGNSSLLGNYQPNPPGVHSSPLPYPWNDPEDLARATNAIKIGIRAWNYWEDLELDTSPPGMDCDDPPPGIDCSQFQPNPFVSCQGTLHVGNSASQSGGLHYITGDLDVGGNEVARGIYFIEGRMLFSGNATYRGDLVILGGHLNVDGFGNAGNVGFLQLHNLVDRVNPNSSRVAWDPNDVDFGLSSVFNINGMGNAAITSDDCEDLQNRWIGINQCLDDLEAMVEDGTYFVHKNLIEEFMATGEDPMDDPDFDGNENVRFNIPRCGAEGQPRSVLASWREYIDRQRWVDN